MTYDNIYIYIYIIFIFLSFPFLSNTNIQYLQTNQKQSKII